MALANWSDPAPRLKQTSYNVNVLRSTLGDCTAGGPTSRFTSFTLLAPNTPVPERADPKRCLRLNWRCGRWQADPLPEGMPPNATHAGGMFGGNYVVSSDSRFREDIGHPVPVHDRAERWEAYYANLD